MSMALCCAGLVVSDSVDLDSSHATYLLTHMNAWTPLSILLRLCAEGFEAQEPGSAVLPLRGPSPFRRRSHLCACRRRHPPLRAPRRHLRRVAGRHLHSLYPRLCAALHLTPVLTRELVDQLASFAANKMQRLEHRVALLQPLPRVRLRGAEQPADFSRDLLETGRSSLCHADLQGSGPSAATSILPAQCPPNTMKPRRRRLSASATSISTAFSYGMGFKCA